MVAKEGETCCGPSVLTVDGRLTCCGNGPNAKKFDVRYEVKTFLSIRKLRKLGMLPSTRHDSNIRSKYGTVLWTTWGDGKEKAKVSSKRKVILSGSDVTC